MPASNFVEKSDPALFFSNFCAVMSESYSAARRWSR